MYYGRSFVSQKARGHLEEDQALVALELAHGASLVETRSTKPPLGERNCAVPVEGLAGHILGTLTVHRGQFW